MHNGIKCLRFELVENYIKLPGCALLDSASLRSKTNYYFMIGRVK